MSLEADDCEAMFLTQAQVQQIVGSLGGNTSVVNVSSGQETNVLIQQLQEYNGMNHLSSDFAKSNLLSISCFESDQYLRNDKYDIKSASSSRFDVGRYINFSFIAQYLSIFF